MFPEWGDIITISPTDKMSLSISGLSDNVPNDDNNIIFKAYHTLSEYVGYSLPTTKIKVDKKIPVQAGLGGGLSNAATCLLVWKRLFLPDLPFEKLLDIGKIVGADVPVCLYRAPCLMQGFGEKLIPLPPSGHHYSMILTKPFKGADTQNIFQKLTNKNNTPLSKNIPTKQLIAHALSDGRNDLAPIAINDTPEITSHHALLNKFGPLKCDVTGSGSASFALFDNSDAAYSALDALRQEFPHNFSTLTRLVL